MKCISYYKGNYKYQLNDNYVSCIGITPDNPVSIKGYIELSKKGKITICKSYAWDGPSGPTIDTPNFMRGSLVHDALYQLMRQGKLCPDKYRDKADRLLQKMCKEDGMSKIRAWWVYQGVRFGGGPGADPANKRKLKKAPKGC